MSSPNAGQPNSGPGPVALVGSGEFLAGMAEVDRALLEGRPPVVAVLPTAAGLEGAGRVRYWLDLAQHHYGDLGATVVEVPVLNRDDAEDPSWGALIAGAGLVYLSGGDPLHLVGSLQGTPTWAAIEDAWRGGAALAGCSAGAMGLAGTVMSVRRGGPPVAGFGVVPGIAVLPHFDRFTKMMDVGKARAALDPSIHIVGVDEDTALVASTPTGAPWTVAGRAGGHLFRGDGSRTSATAGATLHW